VAAEIDREHDLFGDHVAAVGIDVDMADRAHRRGLVLHRDLVDQLGQLRKAAPGIAPHPHRGRAGVLALAGHGAFDPAHPLPMGHDADRAVLGLEDRALFDVVFEHRVDPALARTFVPLPADPFKLVAEAQPLRVAARQGVVDVDHAREHPRGEHRGRKAGAFLVRPVDEHDGAAGADPQIADRADQFQPRQHPQHPVEPPARRLGVEVASDIDGVEIGLGPLVAKEHVAHGIDAHAHAGRLAPGLQQAPALGIGIGQRLAVVAARDAGADPGHLHQAVPPPHAVRALIVGRGAHR
jgi:hypothetical protein